MEVILELLCHIGSEAGEGNVAYAVADDSVIFYAGDVDPFTLHLDGSRVTAPGPDDLEVDVGARHPFHTGRALVGGLALDGLAVDLDNLVARYETCFGRR